MFICEYCGKEHNGKYGSGRFCSSKCAHGFSTKYAPKTKIAKCKICGSEVEVKLHASKITICNKCLEKQQAQIIKRKRKRTNIKNKFNKCIICGNIYPLKEKCPNKFCHIHNHQHFRTLINKFGFDENAYGTNNVEKEFNRIRDNIYDLYWNQHKSSSEICEIYNYSSGAANLQKIFKNILFIPSKTAKESQKENVLMGRIDPLNGFIGGIFKPIQQWYITWNNKEVFLRSSYELKYAQELDEQKIDYEVEGLRIKYWDSQKQEYRCAIPDFYIPDENMIVEIKSEWTLDKQNMIDKKKAYIENGYKFKCICDFNEIEI